MTGETLGRGIVMSDERITAVYNPRTGMVGCVLLQAAYNCDSRVSNIFGTEDWELAPAEGQALMTASLSEWEWLAGLPRTERVARWRALAE